MNTNKNMTISDDAGVNHGGWYGRSKLSDEMKQKKKKRSLREGKDMGDYLLTNISKRGIISCRFLSFFPISPEARQAAATAMPAPTLSLTHNGSSDPVLIKHDLRTGDGRSTEDRIGQDRTGEERRKGIMKRRTAAWLVSLFFCRP